MIYLKTVDEAGQDIDPVTLDTVAAALASVAPIWTSERFGLAGIERGRDTRIGVSGWITVRWPNPMQEDVCGRAQVGVDGGWIELNCLANCGCAGSRMRPRTAKHELGHALGFWHTGQAGDLMATGLTSGCDVDPSPRERLHASIAYGRPVGNVDPDGDPVNLVSLHSLRAVAVP